MKQVPTQHNGLYVNPQWSSDGSQILLRFTPANETPSPYRFVTMQKDGSRWSEISVPAQSIRANSAPFWWGSGSIAFIRFNAVGPTSSSSALVIYDLAAGAERVLTTGLDAGTAAWTFRTQQVAFSIQGLGDNLGLALYDIRTGHTVTLYTPPPGRNVGELAWDPTGERIAYVVGDGPFRSHLEVMTIRTASRVALSATADLGATSSPTWSPDGKWIAVRNVDRSYGSTIVLAAVDGTVTKTVNSTGSVVPVELAWSPVSNELLVTSLGQPGQNSIYLLDLSSLLTTK